MYSTIEIHLFTNHSGLPLLCMSWDSSLHTLKEEEKSFQGPHFTITFQSFWGPSLRNLQNIIIPKFLCVLQKNCTKLFVEIIASNPIFYQKDSSVLKLKGFKSVGFKSVQLGSSVDFIAEKYNWDRLQRESIINPNQLLKNPLK